MCFTCLCYICTSQPKLLIHPLLIYQIVIQVSKMWNSNGHRNLLSFCSWNIDGLKKNLGSDNVLCRLSRHDFIALQETHTSHKNIDSAIVDIDGFSYLCKHSISNDTRKGGRGSGGLFFMYRHQYYQGLEQVQTTNDYTLWVKLSKQMFGWDQDLYVCTFYIPPHDSPYFQDQFEKLETEIAQFSQNGDVLIMGDSNSRTLRNGQTTTDHITRDSDKYLPLPDSYIMDSNSRPRASMDSTGNSHGLKLTELCIASQIRILNGRTPGDYIGKFTCHHHNGSSIVDYFLCNERIIDRVICMNVQTLLPNSIHCPMTCTVKCDYDASTTKTIKTRPLPTRYKLTKVHEHQYLQQLLLPETLPKIEEFMLEDIDRTQSSIDLATNNLNKIFLEAAINIARPKPRKRKNKPKPSTPQNSGILAIRQRFRSLASQLSKKTNNFDIRSQLFSTKKKINRLVKKANTTQKQNLFKKLENMHENDPKAYWKTIQDIVDNNQPTLNFPNDLQHKLHEHFKTLNQQKEDLLTDTTALKEELELLENHLDHHTPLDNHIKTSEIVQAIKKLKYNKTSGLDQISNEMLKYSGSAMLSPLAKLFNKVLNSGTIPTAWSEGYIMPLHKKGSKLDTDNYRGITITSCLGRVFSSIMNHRLTNFIEKNKIIPDNQAGFRKDRRTADNLFILKTLINKYVVNSKQKLYMCFIDFRKAFDSVWRDGLLLKLLRHGIGGNFYRTLKNMYSTTQVSVKLNDQLSEFFDSNIGVKQGDNLSPTLFNLFINDINFPPEDCSPVKLLKESLSHLLWADDMLLLSETAEGLQQCLDTLHKFCNTWQLEVNITKSNVMIVKKTKTENPVFYLGKHIIPPTDKYTYLGCTINSKGTFSDTREELFKKSLKALFKLNQSFSGATPPPNLFNKLFDTMIKPILLYNSEIWSSDLSNKAKKRDLNSFFNDNEKESFELLHNKFCKMNLQVGRKSTNIACKGELGRFPMIVDINTQVLKYWQRLDNLPSDRTLLLDAYEYCKSASAQGKSSWLDYPNTIVEHNKMQNLVNDSKQLSPKVFSTKIKNSLSNNYVAYYTKKLNESEKLTFFKDIKREYRLSPYLNTIKNINFRKTITKLRISAHKLEIETGRYKRPRLDRELRICRLCDKDMGDELHFLCKCPLLQKQRQLLFTKLASIDTEFDTYTDAQKCIFLLDPTEETCPIVGQFCYEMMDTRDNLLRIPYTQSIV
jgi:exonuclease III